ncbi:hypothetical protein PYW07_010925 [Mythimna separata]|uniref:C2H2-type domain-containing protein n=1 Tax=Mythimna separata TaxID=271217 RepID=A0AAD7Y893_MYTSE|nr:hypothetical protein PYW07_010925 [Mythimna separata]
MPLGEIGDESSLDIRPKFYRLNDVIFAEPLTNAINEGNSFKDDVNKNEIKIIDNIVISKEAGKKYNKYHFNMEDGSATICPQLNCHRTFSTRNLLLSHIRRVHCADRNRYICEHCGRGFPERHMLRRHADTHSDDTVQCPVCGVQLRLRTRRVHCADRNRYICEHCGRGFPERHMLRRHADTHSDDTVQCPVCGVQLRLRTRRVHCADRNRYICEQCGRGFPERHMLRRHADTHSDDTVQCPVCGVQLRSRTSLATHLRSHSNERPHQCEVCTKSFARASSKAAHVKFVHREGLLECQECDKRFSSRKQWSLHMKTHREKKPD